MRAITLLHSRGLVSDEFLYRTTAEASQADDAVLTGLGEAISIIDDQPVLVIDDLQALVDQSLYQQAVDDIVRLIDRAPQVKIVVSESDTSAIDSVQTAHIRRVDIRSHDLPTSGATVGALQEIRDPNLLKHLCITALPPSVDRHLAVILTGNERSAELLDDFERLGLGSWVKNELQHASFEYRGAIRREALSFLRRQWSEDWRAASRELARWYLAHGHPELALEYAIDGEEIDLVGHIALRAFPLSMRLAELTLDRIAALPIGRVKENALLSMWMGIQIELSPRSHLNSEEFFRAAIDAARVRPRGLSDTERLLFVGIEAYALRRTGEARRSAAAAMRFHARAITSMAADGSDPDLDHAFAHFTYQACVSLMYGDQHAKAMELLTASERFCHTRGIAYGRNSAIAARSYLEAIAGRTHDSEALAVRVSDEDWPRVWRGGNIKTYFLLSAIVRAAHRADFVALRNAVEDFRPTAGTTEHWDIFLTGEVLLLLAEGNTGAARVRFETTVRSNVDAMIHPGILRRLTTLRRVLTLVGERPIMVPQTAARDSEYPINLALRAAFDLDRRRIAAASEKLGRATVYARTPVEQHLAFTMLARLGIARQDMESVRSAASHLHVLLQEHGLRIGFTLLSVEEKESVLATTTNAGPLAEAFAALRPFKDQSTSFADLALTPKQLTIITQLARHGDRQKVAQELYLSPATVKAHLRTIYKKLDAHSQAEAIFKAAAAGLIVEQTFSER